MQRALRVLRTLLAAATAAVCLLLVWQVVDIYRVGNLPENFSAPGVRIQPVWSREIVGARLSAMAPALLGYLALAAAGLVCEAVSTPEKGNIPAAPEDTLAMLRSRVAEVPDVAKAEQRRRRSIWLAAAGVCAVCILFAASYLLRRESFTSLELESVMGQMLLHVGPWVALGFLAACTASVCAGWSVRREISILKAAPKGSPAAPVARKSPVPILRAVLYAAAIALVAAGVVNGGLWDVLVKAVNICTECIGLG